MKMKKRFILLIIIFLTLVFYFFGFRRTQQKTYFTDNTVLFVLQPVVSFFQNTFGFFSHFTDHYIFLVHTKQDNDELTKQVHLLRLQNQSLNKLLDDANLLDQVEGQYSYLHKALLPVKILGFDPFLQSKTLWINAGEDKAIHVNAVVVAPGGLVGRVIQVFDHSSKVLLITDSLFSVDAVNQRTQLRCLIQGLSDGELQIRRMPYLSQVEFFEKGRDVQNGDMLVTSGIGGIYPPGIPLGHIVDIKQDELGYFEKSLVAPAVDFAKANSLYVLLDLGEKIKK